MASSIETSKISSHFQSISLPSRSHPLTTTVEEQLSRLRSLEVVSSSSSASQSLGELKSLYDCIDDLLQLPLPQQVLSHLRSPSEELLDVSLQPLDVCANVRESFYEGMCPGTQVFCPKKEKRRFQLPLRSRSIHQLSQIVSSSSSASQSLGDLENLYDCIDDLLQLPLTQQVLSHLRSPAEESLDVSLQLFDVCANVREAFSQMKECVQELKSSFRRRKRGDSSFSFEVEAYTNTRKKLNKLITKYLRNLKKKGSKKASLNEATVSVLTEAGEISLSVFGSLLGFLALTSASTKPRGRSLVSKLLEAKRFSCDGGEETNEVQGLDALLLSLRSSKNINNQAGNLSKRLEELELSIQEIEDDLEYIFRRLVKLRFSLLNIVNH